jgi:hypothetical protein
VPFVRTFAVLIGVPGSGSLPKIGLVDEPLFGVAGHGSTRDQTTR